VLVITQRAPPVELFSCVKLKTGCWRFIVPSRFIDETSVPKSDQQNPVIFLVLPDLVVEGRSAEAQLT
jgi:hypothetical protein